jgi:hypothetical protein
MIPRNLTKQQLAFFDTFGFLVFPGLFAAEIDDITTEFERVWSESGLTHDHLTRSGLIPFVDRSAYLSSLIDHPRINLAVGSILGDDYNYTGSDGNYYVGDTNWHSDRSLDVPYRSLKIAFYLDPVDADSGCLRVIPGSCHHGDAFSDALHEVAPRSRFDRTKEAWGVQGSEVPACAVASTPGDMLLFNHKTKHSAWGGGTRRRMFTYNFEEHMSGEQLTDLVQLVTDSVEDGRVYGEAMLRTAGADRMRHLEQRLQIAEEEGLV